MAHAVPWLMAQPQNTPSSRPSSPAKSSKVPPLTPPPMSLSSSSSHSVVGRFCRFDAFTPPACGCACASPLCWCDSRRLFPNLSDMCLRFECVYSSGAILDHDRSRSRSRRDPGRLHLPVLCYKTHAKAQPLVSNMHNISKRCSTNLYASAQIDSPWGRHCEAHRRANVSQRRWDWFERLIFSRPYPQTSFCRSGCPTNARWRTRHSRAWLPWRQRRPATCRQASFWWFAWGR